MGKPKWGEGTPRWGFKEGRKTGKSPAQQKQFEEFQKKGRKRHPGMGKRSKPPDPEPRDYNYGDAGKWRREWQSWKKRNPGVKSEY